MSRLFVIKKRYQDQFWCCSTEHGSGWSEGHPKQSFSPSEVTKEIRRLIDSHWNDVILIELKLEKDHDVKCNSTSMPMEMSQSCVQYNPGTRARDANHMADFERVR